MATAATAATAIAMDTDTDTDRLPSAHGVLLPHTRRVALTLARPRGGEGGEEALMVVVCRLRLGVADAMAHCRCCGALCASWW